MENVVVLCFAMDGNVPVPNEELRRFEGTSMSSAYITIAVYQKISQHPKD